VPLWSILLVALALVVVLATVAGLAVRRFGWAPGARHAWGEAGFRAGATWGDFVDWLRLGR
jgi:hypothetical protein